MHVSALRRHGTAIGLLVMGGIVVLGMSPVREKQVEAILPSVAVSRTVTSEPHLDPRALPSAVERRDAFLRQSIVLHFRAQDGTVLADWNVALGDHPLWILFDRADGGTVSIDRERLKQELISFPPEGIPVARQCAVQSSSEDEKGVTRVTTDCIARDGYRYDPAAVAEIAAASLERGDTEANVLLEHVAASVVDSLHVPGKQLVRLGTGRSTFTGSGYGRKLNVRKAINEREHNIVVPADAEFSFNDTLGTVSVGNGWQMALTIFEGVNLRPAPGGGICQASTTLYRAVLNAGLPILEQKSHSLYVTYYEPHGVGLDATVFPGKQDFRFKNDTGAPLLIQAFTEGEEATVEIYGVDDGRRVTLSGPYFAASAPDDLRVGGKKVGANQIVWERTVDRIGAEQSRDIMSAKYKAIPRSLPKKWTATTTVMRGDTPKTTSKDVVASDR